MPVAPPTPYGRAPPIVARSGPRLPSGTEVWTTRRQWMRQRRACASSGLSVREGGLDRGRGRDRLREQSPPDLVLGWSRRLSSPPKWRYVSTIESTRYAPATPRVGLPARSLAPAGRERRLEDGYIHWPRYHLLLVCVFEGGVGQLPLARSLRQRSPNRFLEVSSGLDLPDGMCPSMFFVNSRALPFGLAEETLMGVPLPAADVNPDATDQVLTISRNASAVARSPAGAWQ
jgi:hypothetical protein